MVHHPAAEVKDGVSLDCLKPIMQVALDAAVNAYAQYGKQVVITSTCEEVKTREPDSRHYLGLAMDLRTRHLEGDEVRIRNLMLAYLGNGWNVVVKYNPKHIHVEYDPK